MTLSDSASIFEALLHHLKHSHGCDLTGYKRSSLMRRFNCRMQRIGIIANRPFWQLTGNNASIPKAIPSIYKTSSLSSPGFLKNQVKPPDISIGDFPLYHQALPKAARALPLH